MNIKVNTKGLLCPKPLIETKKAIKEANIGDKIEVILDNDTAKCNLLNFLKEMNIDGNVSIETDDIIVSFILEKSHGDSNNTTDNIVCPTTTYTKEDYVVIISSEFMGDGDSDLGALLMRAFINTLIESDNLPSHILMYNGGVKKAVIGTDTAASLIELEKKGVTIIVCGTCVDYFAIKDKLAVGIISNMYKIVEIQTKASKIIRP